MMIEMAVATGPEPAVLFVDDEEIIRKSFSRDLRLAGFRVTAVAGGEEAVRALAAQPFELLITDLMMPDMDGFAVLKAAKEISPFMAVIILTGYGDIGAAIEALRLGADDFTQKPCEIEELVFRIRRCLEKRSLLERLTRQNYRLEEEVAQRRQIEAELVRARNDLEERVRERTAELSEANIALTVLLKKREGDRELLAERVLSNAAHLLDPFLARLRESRLSEQQRVLVEILTSNLGELTSPFTSSLSGKLARLTPAEIQVANLVKLGKRTKEIAAILHLSPGTISIHRKNIRKKLALTHQKTNLQTALSIGS